MPMVVYSVLRLALFAAVLVALWFAGMRGWLLVLVAALIALLLSYLVLRGPREAAARYLAELAPARARTRSADEDAAVEDAAVEGADGDD